MYLRYWKHVCTAFLRGIHPLNIFTIVNLNCALYSECISVLLSKRVVFDLHQNIIIYIDSHLDSETVLGLSEQHSTLETATYVCKVFIFSIYFSLQSFSSNAFNSLGFDEFTWFESVVGKCVSLNMFNMRTTTYSDGKKEHEIQNEPVYYGRVKHATMERFEVWEN